MAIASGLEFSRPRRPAMRARPRLDRAASRRRLVHLPDVDFLEDRTLLDGDPLAWRAHAVDVSDAVAASILGGWPQAAGEEPLIGLDTAGDGGESGEVGARGGEVGQGQPPFDSFDGAGAGSQAGEIEAFGERDLFRIVAPVAGLLEVRLEAAPGTLEGVGLTLTDDSDDVLAVLDDTLTTADAILPQSRTGGTLAAGDVDHFVFTLTEAGRLTARVQAVGVETRLSLLRSDGELLIQSDGQAPDRLNDFIDQHLAGHAGGTSYLLKVEGLGAAAGTYVLTTEFQPVHAPFRPIPLGGPPRALLSGDYNGDGRPDLATANDGSDDISVLLGLGDGTFRGGASISLGGSPSALLAGDYNGDGRPDLAVAYGSNSFSESGYSLSGGVTVLLGSGDGTFRDETSLPVAGSPSALLAGDFNGDGRPDLAVTFKNPYSSDGSSSSAVSVLEGSGDGTFRDGARLPVNGRPTALLAGDFNGDGRPDLAVASYTSPFTGGVTVLPGLGDGAFRDGSLFPVRGVPIALLGGDFNGDGRADLAVTSSGGVTVLRGTGDGAFRGGLNIPVAGSPSALLAGDFNGDGRADLAVTSSGGVTVLMGTGDGTFRGGASIPVSGGLSVLLSGDFNGDGRPDLAVADGNRSSGGSTLSGDVTVLLGLGDGAFRGGAVPLVTGSPSALLAGDLNGDGRPDLAVTYNSNSADGSSLSSGVSALLGTGDGMFRAAGRVPVGGIAGDLLAGDFNGDGRPDLAVTYGTSSSSDRGPAGGVTVLLGLGDGMLRDAGRIPVAGRPSALLANDFNGDGRRDLAVAYEGSSSSDRGPAGGVTVLLGTGDGVSRGGSNIPLAGRPLALLTGDFNGDGRPDLAVTYDSADYPGGVTVLLGTGDGSFRGGSSIPLAGSPSDLLSGDFNGDGRRDLAVAYEDSSFLNRRPSGVVTVLLGTGDGAFRAGASLPVGGRLSALLAGDFNGDGRPDLAVSYGTFSFSEGGYSRSGVVTVLLGTGDGAFRDGASLTLAGSPSALLAGDFNGDGRPDLATTDLNSEGVTVLLGTGDGRFRDVGLFPTGGRSIALLSGDFNGDGRPDLATASANPNDVSVLLGVGGGAFVDSGTFSNPNRATPRVADFSGDGVPDVAITDQNGEILLRLGRPGIPGVFEPPLILNPDPAPTASDLAVVVTPRGSILAALDARGSSVSLYARGPNRQFQQVPGPAVPGTLPIRIASADLNGDGRGDLAVATAGGAIFLYFQDASGGFGRQPDDRVEVGAGLSDLTIVEVDGVQGPDLVATNQISGDVILLLNGGLRPFATVARFRAGLGLSGVEGSDGALRVRSQEGTAGVVAADLNGDGVADLIVANSGADGFSVLLGTRTGGFLNPQPGLTLLAGDRPAVLVAGRFDGDPFPDVAVLNRAGNEVLIFRNKGTGRFSLPTAVDTGLAPSGLAARDVDGDGRLDLMVGNDFGDILTLLGNGDGSFQPYQRVDRNVTLAVADLNGDGINDFVFGNESLDRVSVTFGGRRRRPRFERGRQDGLLAPGAVTTADLDRDGIPDLIVANSGSNDVLVYIGRGGGQFAPARSFFAGQNPAGLSVQDLDSDGDPDLAVANEGSNDVSILFGQGQGTRWTLLPGPRVEVGGSGPVSTLAVPDSNGDGIPELLVTNGASDSVTLFYGRRDGFLNRGQSLTFRVGAGPQEAFVGFFDRRPGLDLVTINAGSDDLTFLSGFLTSSGPRRSVRTGGSLPVAGLAGDFNGDGFGDLVVAHNGDGVVSLLLGGLGGLSLAATASHPDLAHPTAVARSALGIAVVDEGEEAISLFTLAFDFGIAVLPPGTGTQPTEQADFLPLPESNLALIAVLLTDRLGATAAARTRSTSSDVDVVASGNTPLINYLIGLDPSFDRDAPDAEDPEPASEVGDLLGRSLNRWLSVVIGKNGRTWDLLVGVVRDAVQAVASAVSAWLAPLPTFCGGSPAEGGPPEDAIPPDGSVVSEVPVPPSDEEKAEPTPTSREDLDPGPPVAIPLSSDGRPGAEPSAEASSRIDAIADPSAGVLVALIAYQACWSERRSPGTVDRDPRFGAAGRPRSGRGWRADAPEPG